MKRNLQFFTMIELLVVIAIISILMSIMLPSIHKARNKIKAAACLNNQKELGLGLTIFSTDEDSFLTTNANWNDNWQEKLYPSLLDSVKVFACPSDNLERPNGTKMSYGGYGWYVSSNHTNTWSDGFEAFGLRISSPQLADSTDALTLSELYNNLKTIEGGMFQYPFQPADGSFNHSVKQTAWFIDGHAELLGIGAVIQKNHMFFAE